MSSVTVERNQDELDAVCVAHYKTFENLGHNENVGKGQAVCGKGLVHLHKLITAVLIVSPKTNLSKTQWRTAIADTNEMKSINKSGLSNKVWCGHRA